MYPSLYDAALDLLGVEIPILKIVMTYGFFMFLGFLGAIWTTRSEFIRNEKDGRLGLIQKSLRQPNRLIHYSLSIIIGFLVGWKLSYFIVHFNGVSENPQDFMVSGKGFIGWGLIGAITLSIINFFELKKNKVSNQNVIESIHPYQLIPNFVIIAAISGLLGANIFAHLNNIEELIKNPMVFFENPLTGGVFLGALIGGAIGVSWYARRNNIHWILMGDMAAPGLILAYGIGRMGCHLSGDGDWGVDNLSSKPEMLTFLPDWMWAYDYPRNIHNIVLENPVWPTSFYESFICIGLFFILWFLRKRTKPPGILFSIYLIFVGTERLLIEKIRINEEHEFFNLNFTQAEFISTIILLLGIFGFYYFPKIKKESLPMIESG